MSSVVQFWDDLEAAGGSIVIPELMAYQSGSSERRIDNNDGLSLVAPRDAWWRSSLALRYVARVTDPLSTVTEWRVKSIVDGRGRDPLVRIDCEPIILDLLNTMIQNRITGGATDYDLGGVELTITQYLANYVIPSLEAQGYTWWKIGTVDDTSGLYDIGWPSFTALELCQELARRASNGQGADLWISRVGGTGYEINIGDRGAGANVVRCEMHRNLIDIVRTQDLQDLVTVALPVGARVDGAINLATCAQAAWEVTAVATDTPSTGIDRITVQDPNDATLGPLVYDDQANDWYILKDDATLVAITDSDATNQYLYVADATGISVGDHIELRRDSSGGHISELVHPTNVLEPSAGGFGRMLRIIENTTYRGERNHCPNGTMADWASGNLPDNWTQVDVSHAPTGEATHQRDRTVTNPGSGAADGAQGPGATVLVKSFPANFLVQAGDKLTHSGTDYWVTDNVTLSGAGAGTITVHSAGLTVSDNDAINITRLDVSGSAGSDYAIYHRYWGHNTTRIVTPAYKVRYDPSNTTLWASVGFSVLGLTSTLDISDVNRKPTVEIYDEDGASVLASVVSDTLSFSGAHNPVSIALRVSYTMTADANVSVRMRGATNNGSLTAQQNDYGSVIRWVTLHLGPDPRIPVIEGSHANALWHLGNNALTSSITTRYDVTLQDLASMNCYDPDDETLVLGGDVNVIDDVLGIDITARIVAIKADLLNPMRTIVTLASNRPKGSALLLPARFAPEVESTAPIAVAEEVIVNTDQSITVNPDQGQGFKRLTKRGLTVTSEPQPLNPDVEGIFV